MPKGMKGISSLLQRHVTRKSAILKAMFWQLLLEKPQARIELREGNVRYHKLRSKLLHARNGLTIRLLVLDPLEFLNQHRKFIFKTELREDLHLFLFGLAGFTVALLASVFRDRNTPPSASDSHWHQHLHQLQIVTAKSRSILFLECLISEKCSFLKFVVFCGIIALKLNQYRALGLFIDSDQNKLCWPDGTKLDMHSFCLTFGGSDIKVVDVPRYC